ncbi:surfeit locus protein 6 homolog [Tigriopus californicus]|uniref:surfeit locus protein 6 homolog n=1 Tax=Tigriopus californicus TaxID=6832 RepID=UPI0027DA314D|nr:surfeit locus protein 6 homolog [Tigriopus californicus]
MMLEDAFVGRLLSHMYVPQHQGGRKLGSRVFGEAPGLHGDEDDHDSPDMGLSGMSEAQRRLLFPKLNGRAKSMGELQDRFQKKMAEFQGQRKDKKGKKNNKKETAKLTKVEKRQKAKEKKKLQKRLVKTSTAGQANGSGITPANTKPVYNSEGKVVFSKFDFSEDSAPTSEVKAKISGPGGIKAADPKAALQKIKKHKEKIKTLKAEGKMDAVKAITDHTAWKSALDKAEGVKVKDDETLLKKTIKKHEQKKKSSKKKWDDRQGQVEQTKANFQKKRSENLKKRKDQVKQTKVKKAAKRGRLVPGFR